MQIIHKIAAWAAGQPAWIDDALRRLMAGRLEEKDLRELADLAKAEHGLTGPNDVVPVRLDPALMPAARKDGIDVSLKALRSPQHLNAIDAGQALTFEAAGLTVVYGNNGAGKSGYARALKMACRARNVENILPDVYVPSKDRVSSGATFDWNEGQAVQSQAWTVGTVPPQSLSQLSGFDAHCARVFVDNQAKVLFVPDGMEIIHGLSDAPGAVQGLIEKDRKGNVFDQSQLATLVETTVVGRAVAQLGRKSDVEALKKLAMLSEDDEAERQVLTKLLKEEDPVKLAAAIRRTATRVGALRNELVALETPLLDKATAQLADSFVVMVATEAASKLTAEVLKADGATVTGTGTERWEILMRSAKKYATEVAYPGHEFPGPDHDAHCVLCQQPLSEEANDRLKSFVRFLEADAQKKAIEAREITKKLYLAIKALNFDAFPADRALLDELHESQPALEVTVREYVVASARRQTSVLAMAPNRKLDPLEALPESPIATLDELIRKQTGEAGRLEKALTPEERERKTKVLADLEARTELAQLLPKVLEAIEWHKRDHSFGEAIKGCTTRPETAKISESYEAHVTEELRAAFAQELASLGLGKQAGCCA